jgi:serine/threonine protein kinase
VDIFPVIPGYKIEKEVGEGRLSEVYLGVQEDLDQKVAIKILNPALLQEKAAIEQFQTAAGDLSRLTHPNIANILEAGEASGVYYIVMENLPQSLRDKLNGTVEDELDLSISPLDEISSMDIIGAHEDSNSSDSTEKMSDFAKLNIIKQVAWALDFAQKLGLTHQDITPESIRFREDGTPVLTGFFLSEVVGTPEQLKKRGIPYGSPYYISPEQALGKTPDIAGDIYSLGIVLHELLTGRVPYMAEEAIAIENQHIMEPIPQLASSLSRFQELLDKMMEKTKEDRISSPLLLVQAIDELTYKLPDNKRKKERELEIPKAQPQETVEEYEKIKPESSRKPYVKSHNEKKLPSLPDIDIEGLIDIIKNPKVFLPVIGGAVLLALLYIFILSPSDAPPDTQPQTPTAGEAQAEQKKPEPEKETKPLTEEEKKALEELNLQYNYKLQLAKQHLKKNKFDKAIDMLKQTEALKKTPETDALAKQIAQKKAEQKDNKAFQDADQKADIKAYEQYLERFPSGLHTRMAQDKIAAIKEKQRIEKEKRDKLLSSAIKLRSQYQEIDNQQVKEMLHKYNFFEKYYNKEGNFKNKFELIMISENEKVVNDYATGLSWHQAGSISFMSLEKAKKWLAELNEQGYAGHKDWRLPTLEEAVSLLESTESQYALYTNNLFSYEQRFIWTGDTFPGGKAWAVDFYSGDINRVTPSSSAYIRPVRVLK